MDELKEIRSRINQMDAQIADLFEQRMRASREVIEYKMKRGMSVYDPVREAELVEKNSALVADDTIREYYVSFEKNLMSLSRSYQERIMNGLKVAYAGVPGAFGAIAAAKINSAAGVLRSSGGRRRAGSPGDGGMALTKRAAAAATAARRKCGAAK